MSSMNAATGRRTCCAKWHAFAKRQHPDNRGPKNVRYLPNAHAVVHQDTYLHTCSPFKEKRRVKACGGGGRNGACKFVELDGHALAPAWQDLPRCWPAQDKDTITPSSPTTRTSPRHPTHTHERTIATSSLHKSCRYPMGRLYNLRRSTRRSRRRARRLPTHRRHRGPRRFAALAELLLTTTGEHRERRIAWRNASRDLQSRTSRHAARDKYMQMGLKPGA